MQRSLHRRTHSTHPRHRKFSWRIHTQPSVQSAGNVCQEESLHSGRILVWYRYRDGNLSIRRKGKHRLRNLLPKELYVLNFFVWIKNERTRAQIYLSHNLAESVGSQMSGVVEERPGIQSIQGNIFIFRDGSTAEVDNFIYCTGKKTWLSFVHISVRGIPNYTLNESDVRALSNSLQAWIEKRKIYDNLNVTSFFFSFFFRIITLRSKFCPSVGPWPVSFEFSIWKYDGDINVFRL